MQAVLVIGATGDQGAAQLTALRSAGYRTAGATRDARRSSLPCGTPAVCLDLNDPGSLGRALTAFDTVFLNLPSASFSDPSVVINGFRHFLRVAEETGVARVVFNASLYVADEAKGYPAHDTRHRIVEELLASRLATTVVCPVIFIDNLMRGWALPALRDRRVLRYPHAEDLPVSWISLGDVARLMVAFAEDPATVGQKYIVGGPEALQGAQTAAALSRAWGQTVRFESLPVATFAREMGSLFGGRERSAAERISADLAAIYRWYNEARPSPFTVDMQALQARYGIALTTVYQWGREHRLLA